MSVAAPLCLVYAVGAVLGWGDHTVSLTMGDFGLALAAATAGVSCLVRAVQLRGSSGLSWAMLGTSACMVAIGNAIWGWYEVVLDSDVPSPGVADWFFLFFAPPAIAGLLLVAQRPKGPAAWSCLVLDGWLIAGSLFTLGWSTALARAADGDPADALSIALTLAYPVMDILLVSMVLGLRFRPDGGDRVALNFALVALAITVVSDALWTAPGVHGGYRSGGMLDAGWFAGSVLLALAPWMGAPDRPAADPGGHRTVSILSALTPYIAAAVCTAGVLGDAVAGRQPDPVVLFAGGSVLVVLVVRQGITLVDNVLMAQELRVKESHFRSLVQGSSDVIMIAADDGVLEYVSHAVRRVYGFEPEELLGSRLELLIHPDDVAHVRSDLRRFLDEAGRPAMTRIECRVRSADGAWLHTESAVNRYGDGIILNSRDVTDRVRLQAQLEHDAFHDRLTDLPNRALFEDRIQHALAQRRGETPTVAVLFLDLDGFKAVNDAGGHAVGDELLVQAARRLEHAVRAGDTVARFGGDEFAALLVGDASPEAIREIAERLLATLSAPYRINDQDLRVAASIGIAFSTAGIGPAELMRNADLAMYRAKSRGKGRVEVYAPQMHVDAVRRVEQAARQRRALHEKRLAVFYQPIVELETGRVRDVEAMLRRREDGDEPVGATEFLRVSGGADEAMPLGRWILEEVADQVSLWRAAGHDVGASVSLPAGQLTGPDFVEVVDAVLRRSALPPAALALEITEDARGEGADALMDTMLALKRLGVRLSVADFGTGHSSLAYLRRMPIDMLKIDRSFVAEIGTCPNLTALTSTIVRLGLDIGLTLVAAGVDTPEQAALLRDMGCQRGQGRLFAGPLPEEDVPRALGPGRLRERGTRDDEAPAARTPDAFPRPETDGGAAHRRLVRGPADHGAAEADDPGERRPVGSPGAAAPAPTGSAGLPRATGSAASAGSPPGDIRDLDGPGTLAPRDRDPGTAPDPAGRPPAVPLQRPPV
ncbi:EAL domain-containing protein [Yinghuangia sp. ASG 101]|uniref:putative bifunctional diguanylate cyclase/phosphodiesterase n=1 Tax=Yinghuangia sp. ASG 101 TaxID=2896848 RepID=UPI001E3A096E|nr:EAL domain-containing protein [Yinghuangia sp. ASG 101]UGQ14178.1 EAL domain-containing protein [Yinghuangia sp. ASG 101]